MAKLLSGTTIYGTATVQSQLFVSGTTSASATNTGALQVVGGLGVGGGLFVGGIVTATNLSVTGTTSASATNTGALQVVGGVGIGGGLFVGGIVTATNLSVTGYSTFAVNGQFRNLSASATGSTSNVIISFDEMSIKTTANTYIISRSASITIATASVGANGLDTGTLSTATWYSMWAIYNSTTLTTAGLISLSATTPTMPTGYTYYTRVGWIRTDTTANKYPLSFLQKGRQITYVVTTSGNLTALPMAASGVQGSPTTPTYVSVSISNYVPSTADRIAVIVGSFTANQATIVAPNNNYGAYNNTTNPPTLMAYPYNAAGVTFGELFLESTNLYYAASGAGTLQVYGWEDNL